KCCLPRKNPLTLAPPPPGNWILTLRRSYPSSLPIKESRFSFGRIVESRSTAAWWYREGIVRIGGSPGFEL
ncbi:unnamed protein product, partial [Musa acuminata subsp. burmannicoides]